ncbi:RNA polymerase sigma factor [Agromyces sp. LHK192]|uniref:RNA polymerase sigma factor n=1 Tax=Agromyces sp. LHK192 TaxID=2498704 RepID=UPI000FDBDFCE|nr:sigma-70 family RNA polymerase sigma factor [Agromyces sp. LHK192]
MPETNPETTNPETTNPETTNPETTNTETTDTVPAADSAGAAGRVLRAMLVEQPDRLRRRAVSLGLRHEDAEDAAQSVAAAALEHVGAVRIPEEPAICAWVDTIARRVVADEHRRRERERAAVGALAHDAETAPDETEGLDVRSAEAQWEQRERVLATARAIQRLAPQLREVVDLRYGDELPTRDIAERLGISDAAVRQRLTRARAALVDAVAPLD